MPRLMSVALTEPQVRDRTKTVTRRLGWKFLKVGDTITLCRKVMGRKAGEPLVRICDVKIVSVGREFLSLADVAEHEHAGEFCDQCPEPTLEGFPDMTPDEFIAFFCEHMKCTPDTEVTRIEWRYQDV